MITQPHAISHKTTTTIIFSRVMFMKNTTITFTHFVIIPKPYGNTMHVMLVSVPCHKITHQKVAEAFGQRDSSYTFVSLGSQSIYLHIYTLYLLCDIQICMSQRSRSLRKPLILKEPMYNEGFYDARCLGC